MSAPTRADRRRATETRILDSARALFAERGYERTTIRAVAAAARVDPSLVMQHYGSKRDLFARAVEPSDELLEPSDADDTVDHLLTSLMMKLDGLPEGTVATLRSMLTDVEVAEHARVLIGRQVAAIEAAMPTDEDATLRAALVVMAVIGVTLGHQLLELEQLRGASPDAIAHAFRPALEALITVE